MSWLDASSDFERRPLVFVEDHLYHTGDVLAAMHAARPDLVRATTVVALDRRGPDTDASITGWLDRYPHLQIVAAVGARDRVRAIAPADVADAPAVARLIGRLLRPGGVLIQDVQLSTLAFLPADRWWESIYLASTVRGMFPDRRLTVRFLSNKRGYSATFGRDLIEAGFDPRDVMDKADLAGVVVPEVVSLFGRTFPLVLDARVPPGEPRRWPLAMNDAETRDVDEALDLTLWPAAQGVELGGQMVKSDGGHVVLRTGSPEAETWVALVADRLDGGGGLPVIALGARIGPKDAERAELTNLAARHVHTLRSRLADPGAIVTANHAYRLSDSLRVGRVTRA